ncbi:hypothetical protein [Pseudonocardia spinosispora]|uniref:hypothetical protein n=1 Tax=Pseudonocardia spinosispora TaxID=103441 RepID=UPI00048FE605|nr:hypothetical protein [Pseudonocardia spinosispora]
MTLRLVRSSVSGPGAPERGTIRSVGAELRHGSRTDISGGRRTHAAAFSSIAGPLEPDDIRALFGLLRRMEPALARRSVVRLGTDAIGRLERIADLIAGNRLGPSETNDLFDSLYGGLVIPGAAHLEAATVLPLMQRVTAHFGAHYHRLGIHPSELNEGAEANYNLIETFRSGDPDAAADAIRDRLDGCERFALWIRTLD